jgi:hypothetical protein
MCRDSLSDGVVCGGTGGGGTDTTVFVGFIVSEGWSGFRKRLYPIRRAKPTASGIRIWRMLRRYM